MHIILNIKGAFLSFGGTYGKIYQMPTMWIELDTIKNMVGKNVDEVLSYIKNFEAMLNEEK